MNLRQQTELVQALEDFLSESGEGRGWAADVARKVEIPLVDVLVALSSHAHLVATKMAKEANVH